MKNINLAKAFALTAIACSVGFATQAANFTDIAASAGLDVNSRSAGWADFNNDGCLDVMFTADAAPSLYMNNCDSTFTDVTATSGITGPASPWAVAWADYDADGDLDAYVTTMSTDSGAAALWRNNGDGTFTDVAAAVGVTAKVGNVGASWADYDQDGDLDLFVASRFAGATNNDDLLYRNDNGVFTDVAASAGVAGAVDRMTFMGVWFDYDNDGDQDLYLSVDFGDDVLYQNNDGMFTDVSATAGIGAPGHGMGVSIGDLNNDGCFDVVSSNNNRTNPGDDELDDHGPSIIYLNNCDGTFDVASYASGIADRGYVNWGVNYIDYDNDGDLDFAEVAGGMLSESGEPNAFYENDGSGQLHDITVAAGLENSGAAFGSAWVDFDNDGDLDWLVSNVMEDKPNALFANNSAVGNFLKVKLAGADKNLDAIGATVKIVAGSRTQMRTIQAGVSYANSEELIAHFGTGVKDTIDSVTVMWPTGGMTEVTDVAANQTLVIEEEADEAMPVSISGMVTAHDGGTVSDAIVDFRDPDTGEVFFILRADAAGFYAGDIPAGTYQIAALSRENGFAISRPVIATYEEGETVTLNIILRAPR